MRHLSNRDGGEALVSDITERIANVLRKYPYRGPRFVAAAVVDELKLQPEHEEHLYPCSSIRSYRDPLTGEYVEEDTTPRVPMTRYVTEWVADDRKVGS
jgi:hypothetical protein